MKDKAGGADSSDQSSHELDIEVAPEASPAEADAGGDQHRRDDVKRSAIIRGRPCRGGTAENSGTWTVFRWSRETDEWRANAYLISAIRIVLTVDPMGKPARNTILAPRSANPSAMARFSVFEIISRNEFT